MKKAGWIFVMGLLSFNVSGQTGAKNNQEGVAIEASFVGGTNGMMEFISDQIKYPTEDIENKTGGTVYASLLINGEGKIIEVEILRGVSKTIDLEAIRICEKMPNWVPAKDGDGNAIKSTVVLPIRFQLTE